MPPRASRYRCLGITSGRFRPLAVRRNRGAKLLNGPGYWTGRHPFACAKKAIGTWRIHAGSGFATLTGPDRTTVGAVSWGRICFVLWRPIVTCRVFAIVDQDERARVAHEAIRGHPQLERKSFLVERRATMVCFGYAVLLVPPPGGCRRSHQRVTSHCICCRGAPSVHSTRCWATLRLTTRHTEPGHFDRASTTPREMTGESKESFLRLRSKNYSAYPST